MTDLMSASLEIFSLEPQACESKGAARRVNVFLFTKTWTEAQGGNWCPRAIKLFSRAPAMALARSRRVATPDKLLHVGR